jgi:hypothetical protein
MNANEREAKLKARAAKAQEKKKQKEQILSTIAQEHKMEHMSEAELASVIDAAKKVEKSIKNRKRNADLSYVREMCRKHGFTATNLKGYLVVKRKRAPKDIHAYFVEHLNNLDKKEYEALKKAIGTFEEAKSKVGEEA